MKGPFTIKLVSYDLHEVFDADGTLVCRCWDSMKAQRIADALNAAENMSLSIEQELKRYPTGLTVPAPKPQRDPDRVRLAAAALSGLCTDHPELRDAAKWSAEVIATNAVRFADATLAQLDATAKKGTP